MERPRVSAVRVFFRLRGWVFLVPLAVALIFAWVQHVESETVRLLYEYGVDTTARVTAKDRTSQGSEPGRATRYNYHVSYRFEADGEVWTHTQPVNGAFFDSVATDQEIPVRYVRIDPSISEVEAGVAATTATWTGYVAAFAALVALALLYWRGRLIRSALRAARHGEVRKALVTAHTPSAISVGRKRYQRLAWIDSARVKGQSRAVNPKRLTPHPVGASIVVFANPESGRTWWAQDLGIGSA